MAQFARPDSDITPSGWTRVIGGVDGASETPLYNTLDETVADDNDYIRNETGGAACVIGLSNLDDPGSSSGHVVRIRHDKFSGTFTARLKQGSTTIKTMTLGAVGGFTTNAYTLTSGEADSITDYTDLRLEFSTTRTDHYVSWAEFEVPSVVVVDQTGTDSVAFTDASSVAKLVHKTDTDSISFTESENVLIEIAPIAQTDTDSIAFSESETLEIAKAVLATDSIGFTDTAVRPNRTLAVTDSVSLTDDHGLDTDYTFVTPQEIEAHMSASLREATPSTSDPQSQFVRIDGSASEVIGLLGVEHGIEAGKGNEVVHAELRLILAEDMPAGTHNLTVKAIDEEWDANTVTYATRPSVRAITGSESISGLDAGDEVEIDITSILNESVSLEGTTGQRWYGVQLETDGTDELVFYGAYSVQYRPAIEKEVSRPPEVPFNLRPSSGLHVGELRPYFAWDFMDQDAEDTLSMIHFQLDTTDDFETPSYDSGQVASTTSVFDSNSPPAGSAAFANLTNGNTYYWRANHADSHGIWAGWSDPQEFTVTTRATLTLDAVPQVPTPTISWTLSVTQQAYYVLVERYESGWVTHWEQPWTTGTTDEVTLPDSYVLQPGTDVRVTVRVTDTVDRASLPGDLSYYEQTDSFTVPAIVFA